MMDASLIRSQNWRGDIALALCCSMGAILVLAGLLAKLGWHELSQEQLGEYCSVTNCVISGDGRHSLLTYWRPEYGAAPMRYGLATLVLQPQPGQPQATLMSSKPRTLAAIVGNAAYVVESEGKVKLRRIDNGKELAGGMIFLPGGCPDRLVSSADGQCLVAWSAHSLQVFDVRLNAVRWRRERGEVECVALHPQAGLFAALGGQIVQLSLETGAIVRTIADCQDAIRKLVVDSRGTCIAWLDFKGGIELCRLRDARLQWQQKRHGAQTLPKSHRPWMFSPVLSFSPDGRYLVTSASEGDWVLGIWNARTGHRVKTLRGHDKIINGAAFLPDGTLASWSGDGSLRLWNVKRGTVQRIINIHELAYPSRQSARNPA